MSDYPNGGPAFPIPASDLGGAFEPHPGMSLRDYFAAQILGGFVASNGSALIQAAGFSTEKSIGAMKSVPTLAYFIADAMLEAREK